MFLLLPGPSGLYMHSISGWFVCVFEFFHLMSLIGVCFNGLCYADQRVIAMFVIPYPNREER